MDANKRPLEGTIRSRRLVCFGLWVGCSESFLTQLFFLHHSFNFFFSSLLPWNRIREREIVIIAGIFVHMAHFCHQYIIVYHRTWTEW